MVADTRRSLRLMLCADVTALMLLGRKRALKVLLETSLHGGLVRRRFFEELMIHCSLVLGFPHMLQGLELLAAVDPGAGTSGRLTSAPRGLRTRGLRAFRRVYGSKSERVLSALDSLAPGMSDWILDNVYGRVYARNGLSLAEREVVTIVALNHHGHTKQLYGHLRGALRTGLSLEELRRLFLRLRRRHGMRTATAHACLKEITKR